jgi:hypothetical protein
MLLALVPYLLLLLREHTLLLLLLCHLPVLPLHLPVLHLPGYLLLLLLLLLLFQHDPLSDQFYLPPDLLVLPPQPAVATHSFLPLGCGPLNLMG